MEELQQLQASNKKRMRQVIRRQTDKLTKHSGSRITDAQRTDQSDQTQVTPIRST